MFGRIRLRLTLWYVAVLLAIVAAIAGVTYALLYRSLSSEVDDSLETSAHQIAAQLTEESLSRVQQVGRTSGDGEEGRSHEGDGEEEEDEEHGVRFFGATSGDTFYLVLDPGGIPMLNPLNVSVEGVPDIGSASAAAQRGAAWKTITAGGSDYRLYSRAVTDEGRTIAVVQVGRSLEEHQEQLRILALVLVATGMGGLGLATAGGFFVAGRALRPVREAFQRQRSFVADASHELRTPLTLLRGNAEMLQMTADSGLSDTNTRSLQEIIRQTEQIERLVADMSTLARMDEGRVLLQPGPVEIGALVRQAATDAERLSTGKKLRIVAETGGDLRAIADEARVRQLLLALVDNAVRHTPTGGSIDLRAHALDSQIEVTVSDTGPGIPAQHLDRVFERFYRVDPSRSREQGGSGLGLAISRAIAEAHGGTLSASSREGGGATFTLRLPRRGGPEAAA